MISLSDLEINAEHSARTGLTITSGVGLVIFNRIYRTFAASLPWPELRQNNTDTSTTAGTGTYSWPATALFLTLETMEIQDGDALDNYKIISQPSSKLSWNRAERESNAAVPKYYMGKVSSAEVNQFELRPAPLYSSKTIRMTGILEPEEAKNGNSRTVFKLAAADDALAYLVAADFLDADGFSDFAEQQLGNARQLLVKMFGEEAAIVPEQIIRGG